MTPEISLPKEAKKIYSYDTLTEHMWFGFYKMLFCRQRNNLTTTGRTLAYIFSVIIPIAEETGKCYSYHRQWNFLSSVVSCGNLTITDYEK